MELRKNLEGHKGLKFPDWPEDDGFDEWISDLVELDAYYVGLVSSKASGSTVSPISEEHLIKLRQSLEKFKDFESDKRTYEASKIYLDSLSGLIRYANG